MNLGCSTSIEFVGRFGSIDNLGVFNNQVSCLPSKNAESIPGAMSHITLEEKQAGKRSAGKPPAAFDVAGAGNGFTV